VQRLAQARVGAVLGGVTGLFAYAFTVPMNLSLGAFTQGFGAAALGGAISGAAATTQRAVLSVPNNSIESDGVSA